MRTRGKPLTVVHTLSHLEHVQTNDLKLKARRWALAAADKAAGESHTLDMIIPDITCIEAFPLYINGERVEKTTDTPFAVIQRNKRITQLYDKKMEGENAHSGQTP
jgi:hypothetical protein